MPAGVPPDWRLPPGVDRGLWEYLHNADHAGDYDRALAGTPLLQTDVAVARDCFPTPGRLVDLGCGTGRLALDFAARGYTCCGVDLSLPMLTELRTKAAAANLPVTPVRASIVDLAGLADAAFDYAACLFSTLGMVVGATNRQRALAAARRVVRPGGLLLLHVHNRWHELWTPAGRGRLWTDIRAPHPGDRVMPGPAGGGQLTLHLFTRSEATRLLTTAGFRVERIWSLGLGADSRLACPWWCGRLRAYGFLLLARKPV